MMERDLTLAKMMEAKHAVLALEKRLCELLPVADLLRAMGHKTASRELHGVVLGLLCVLRELEADLLALQAVEHFISNRRLPS